MPYCGEKLLNLKIKKLTNKELNKMSEEEVKAYYRSLLVPLSAPTGTASMSQQCSFEKPKDGKKYHCKFCAEGFDTKTELMRHRKQIITQQRKEAFKRSQLTPIPNYITEGYKKLKVGFVGISTRIYSTYFIPPNWTYIKIHEPIKTKNGIWVYIEPIEVTKNE